MFFLLPLLLSEPAAAQAVSLRAVNYEIREGPASQLPEYAPNLTPQDARLFKQMAERIQTASRISGDAAYRRRAFEKARTAMLDKKASGNELPLNDPRPPIGIYPLLEMIDLVAKNSEEPINADQWHAAFADSSAAMVESLLESSKTAGKSDALGHSEWKTAFASARQALIKSLRRPRLEYFDPKASKEVGEILQGRLGSAGLVIKEDRAGVMVDAVIPDSPAKKAGIRSGDVVAEVRGERTRSKTLDAVEESLRGNRGERVGLGIQRGTAHWRVVVALDDVTLPNAFSKMVAPGIGYVAFAQFSAKSPADVFALIDRLRADGAEKLVLDVRNNGGGALEAAAEIASAFLRDGQLIVTEKRQERIMRQVAAKGDGRYSGMPLVLLANESSASASEILASALQDHRRALIVGARTFGKGSQQTILPLQSDFFQSAVKVTDAKWFRPNGESIEGHFDWDTGHEVWGTGGVVPDVDIKLDDAQKESILSSMTDQLYGKPAPTMEDPALDKAIEFLSAR